MRRATALFATAVLASAALIFFVEPMFAKMVLPTLGGAPAVWYVCAAFYQLALLAGYAYAHALDRLAPRAQLAVHAALLAAGAAVLPPRLSATPEAVNRPALWLLGELGMRLALPLVALAASAPLLQRWFSRASDDGRDPYFLYAASNVGSFAALIGYPALAEPLLPLSLQSGVWSVAYGCAALVILACGLPLLRASRAAQPAAPAPPLSWRTRGAWMFLSFAPALMSVSLTGHITVNIAPIPLLWIVPLALYLLTFVIAFAPHPERRRLPLAKLQPFFLLAAVVLIAPRSTSTGALPLAIHLAALFVTALVCHHELAILRPDPRHLTAYYLWMSVGGVLAGMFAAFAAPLLFRDLFEYPVALVLVCLCRPAAAPSHRRPNSRDLAIAALLGAVVFAACLLMQHLELSMKLATRMTLVAGAASLVCFVFSHRPARFAALVAALLIGAYPWERDPVLAAGRTFFGPYRVVDDGTARALHHGDTRHGAQSKDPARRREPLAYYNPESPIADVFHELAARGRPVRAALVGLGAGTLAVYGRAGDRYTFYEIDPTIARLAHDPRLFTFLADSPAATDVVLGDARLTLSRAPRGSFDVIVVDAFSSDAIPVHLLTREALAVYLDKLAPDGVLAFHVSNRYVRVDRVVAAAAAEEGLVAWRRVHHVDDDEYERGWFSSYWVVVGRSGAPLPRRDWTALPRPALRPWTDDFSNVAAALRWR